MSFEHFIILEQTLKSYSDQLYSEASVVIKRITVMDFGLSFSLETFCDLSRPIDLGS
jgi:hypothetical protein